MPQDLYQELLDRLSRVRRRRERLELQSAIWTWLGAALLLTICVLACEAALHLSIAGRTWLVGSWATLVLASAAILFYHPIGRMLGFVQRTTDEQLAQQIGRHYPTLSDTLLNALQLVRPLFARNDMYEVQRGSSALALAAFTRTYSEARPLDFSAIVEERPHRRALLFFLFSILVSLGTSALLPAEMSGAATRLVHFRTFYQAPAPFTLHLTPGNERVMRGDSVYLDVTTSGEQLMSLTLKLREEGQKEFDTITLAPIEYRNTSGLRRRFHYQLLAQHPFEYFAEARGIESERFHITISDHPIVRELKLIVQPPAYTQLRAEAQNENFGDITGIRGTRGNFAIQSSKPLLGAWIDFTATVTDSTGRALDTAAKHLQRFALQVSEDRATGSVTFMQSGSYHITLLDRDSVLSEHPIEYTVTLAADQAPTVALIEPADRADLPNDLRLSMLARIHDDFGFRYLRLGYRLAKSNFIPAVKEYTWLEMPLANHNTQDLDVPYIWNLTKLTLAPEDEVAYVLEVADNDAVTGPKIARTGEYTVRYPSVKEIFERANEQASAAEKNLNEIQQDASELKKKVDEAVNELRQSKSSGGSQKQQEFSRSKDAEQVLARQQDLENRLQDVAKHLDQMTQEMQQQQALSPETMQKYQDLQKLFEQINSPEMKKAMQDLQQAMKNVDPKQLEQAMKNMQFNEEQFKKSIERTSNILKKIQLEQKVDELGKREGELANQEQRAADEQKQSAQQPNKPTPEDRAKAERQQEDAKKELDRLNEEARQLAKDMQKLPQNMQAPEQMKQAQEALADPSIEKSMSDAEQAQQQNDNERSSERSQDAANKLKEAQRKVNDLKRQLSENQKQRDTREMKQIRDELERLSKAEEGIKNQAQQAQQNSNVFRQLAEDQAQKKDQLGQTASKTMDLAQRSTAVPPEMGKQMAQAMNQMQNAEQSMTERDQSGSQQSAQAAMTALNKASQQAQQALDKMSKSGGKGQSGQGQQGGQSGEGQGEGEGDNPGGEGQNGQSGSAMQQFLNSINKLTAQQKALNDMMSGMEGQAGGQAQKQMMEQQAQLAKLAAQQQQVQKSMQDLANEQRDAAGGNKLANDNLKKIADEMQDVVSEMRSSGVRPETIQRQERILSKLLQAQQSVHERDKDEQRESKPGENTVRESPRELDLSTPEGRKQLQDELNKAKESGYSRDYDALIQKYFDALQKAGAK